MTLCIAKTTNTNPMRMRNLLCVSALAVSASFSNAQVTFDSFSGAQLNYSTPVVGGPLAWSHTVGAGSDGALVVGIGFEDGNATNIVAPGGVMFGSQSLTLLGTVRMDSGATDGTGFDNQVSLWYLANPAAGSADITVSGLTMDNPNNNVKGFAGSFFGVGGYTGLTTANGAGGTTSLSFLSLPAGSAVFASANNSGFFDVFNGYQ
jgi:hypothetical protein